MSNCQKYDYTKCSITEGYIKHIKLYITLIVILIFGLIYYLLQNKYHKFLGFGIIFLLIILIVEDQITKFTYPKFKKPEKIPKKYNKLLVTVY